MLIKYVSFIVSALITVSWASSIDSGEQKTATFPQDEEALLKKAPYAPEISSELSSTPFDDSKKAYLWNPQRFHGDLLEALQALSIVENLNFPPSYLKVIEFSSDDSPLSRNYRDYITLNYSKPPYLLPQHQSLFWRSLIFSSFTEFSSISPRESRQIIEQLQFFRDLAKFHLIFGYGLLDDQFLPNEHFLLVTGWCHNPTVKLLLQYRDDISTDNVCQAFYCADLNGNDEVFGLLLKYRTDIPASYVGQVLAKAVRAPIVELLLQSCADIPSEHVHSALRIASKFGYTSIVELILQYRKNIDICSKHAGMALKYASKRGHTSIVELLLQSRCYIISDDFDWALRDAAEGGNFQIVKMLLHRIDDMFAYNFVWALEYASRKGHTPIVNLILQHLNDISANHVFWSLKNASSNIFPSISKLIEQHRNYISSNSIDDGEVMIKNDSCTPEMLSMPFYDFDKYYLWDPQQFHSDLLEALQALSIVENPNIPPPYLKIIEFISNDSPLGRTFRDYITLNYSKPEYFPTYYQPHFWRSLIFSSFTEFSLISPQESSQIIQQLNLFSYLDEVQLLCGYGLLDDQFLPKDHFLLVTGWGHTSTVKLLLQNRDDISYDHISRAFFYAARTGSGHTAIVELLLKYRTNISADDVGYALYKTVNAGDASTVELLLRYRTDIPASYFGEALKKAVHAPIVELLLQSCADIPSEHVNSALRIASEWGYTSVVEVILQYQNDITDDDDDVDIEYEYYESDSDKSEDLEDPKLKEGLN
jgi:ankyrin repeat protein